MTTETIAFMIGYGFFLLIICLLVFAWRRESRILATTKEKLIRAYDEHEGTFKRLNEALSEKQILSGKNLILELKDKEQNKLVESLSRINDNLIDDNNQMSSEIDRGNEMIAQLRDHLAKAYDLNTQNEKIIMQLLVNGKFSDKKGNYKGIPLFEDDKPFDISRYIDSLYRSMIAKDEFDNKRNTVASGLGNPLENVMLTLEEQLRSKNDVIPYVIENGAGGALRKMLDAVNGPCSHIFNFPNSIPKGETNANETITVDDILNSPDLATGSMKAMVGFDAESPAIDWTVPQPFPKNYVITKGTMIVVLRDNFDLIKTGTKGVTTETSDIPNCSFDDRKIPYPLLSCELAPINPTDHPLHPEFKLNA